MKRSFIHTAKLLRAVLLLGVLVFANIQPTKAQTAEQRAAMPDAFETMDPASIIGDGQYYYIQFYTPQYDKLSYLTDRGVNKLAAIMDFLPYANNRLWTLESAGDNNFKLKSKAGYYIGFDRLEGASGNRYVSIANSDAATTFTFQQAREKDGYNIVDLDHGYNNGTPPSLLGRNSNAEWITGISPIRNDNTGKDNSRMRFAKLKSNVAYIIYYRGEGTDNSAPNVNTTRHYLTYSGADAVSNGSLEGDDNSSFFKVEQGGNGRQNANISGGVGKNDSRGIVVHSADNPSNFWDTQFFIRANRMMSPGTTVHLEFDYKASRNATVSTQGHGEPQSYVNEDGGDDINFTTDWQHLSRDFAITGNVQTIAFNLAHLGSATDYYFDNITFNITSDVSSRQSIIPKDKPLCTLPTLAAYHQDGLWTLEETGNGDFYIKKYGDEQYLTVQQIDTYNYRTVLGNKDNVHGRFNLEDPNANRYTRVHNNTATNIWGLARYLTYNNGDGSPVVQSTGERSDYWYASFYPVEVPVPNKDEFFQVLVKWGNNMIDHNGGSSALPANESDYHLWQLEMIDDYGHFRLKNPQTGRYLAGAYQMTEPNDPTGAEINNNAKFFTDFSLEWFFVNPVDKEIVVDHYVRHKESYLRAYADDQVIANQEGLRKQGLATDVDSEWKNFNGNLDGMTQKTNHFEITHYVKKGNSLAIEFPTVLNKSNDHVYFQRFYHYDEVDEGAGGDGMDLDNLKAHVSLDTRDDGNVQYFLYKNGMVTGQKLDWNGIEDGGFARNEQRRFNFTNSDGERFTVGVDVSRYSDLKYLNTTDHLNGDLEEPSLTMRYIFYMRDAKEMAANLTACPEGGTKWLEEKTFHFGRTQVPYTKFKKVGYRGEFIPVRHVFSDYWVYDDPRLIDESYLASLGLSDEALKDYLDQHLVSAVNDNNGGKIEVEIDDDDDNPTGIRLGGWNPNIDLRGYTNEGNDADYQGFYFYDKIARNQKTLYGNSRFVVFRYPASGQVNVPTNTKQEAKLNVFFNAGNGRRYQLAQYTIIFDANMATRPWTEIKNGTSYANGINKVKDEDRDPNKLRLKAGKPIAKVSFDFPEKMVLSGTEQDAYYHYPQQGETIHNSGWGSFTPNEENNYTGTIANSSPVPLTFDHTNYSFDGDGCNWGSYALVTTKKTDWGNQKTILPADDAVYGYNIDADPGMRKAFLYIDASEQPGDICAMNFEGEFCANDKLMCSGWISGSNRYNDDGEHRCPGSITITIKGEDINGNTKTIYRFCPGQIYELDNGYGDDGHGYAVADVNAAGNDGSGNEATHVVWQQFFFEFSTDQKYERYWLEVNNNCVSSNGGDFMIDNVEVYTIVPEVEPEINTPLCVSVDENGQTVTEMRLLKLDVNFNKLKSSAAVTTGTAKVGFVFLEKEVFLKTLWTRKTELSQTYADLDAFAQAIKEGKYLLDSNDADYRAAFDAALLGEKKIWNSTSPTTNMGGGIMYYQWSSTFEDNNVQPVYSFAKAVNKQGAVFRYEDEDGQWLVFNGNYPGLNWKTNTDYYIVPSNTPITNPDLVYSTFNILSECSKATVFQIEPPYRVLGLEGNENTEEYVVCEGQIPTLLLDLKGYDLNGNEVDMTDLNYDWWLGKKGDPTATPAIPPVLATLTNYHTQSKTVNGETIRLDKALSTMRTYYPRATSLDGVVPQVKETDNPKLTQAMIDYLKELVEAGELVLHQKSVSVPAEPASEDDPYFYLVACPIHDELFDQALNPGVNEYVSYYCDEPQGVRIKVGEKAPTLKSGFVPGEHGFTTYDYNFPAGTDPVLSIRLAKKDQFETVKNTEEEATNGTLSYEVNHLWLPIRNARTQTASGVIQKSDDDNIYLASTNDPTWDKMIYQSMRTNGLLPIVGRIVSLNAINTQDNSEGAAPGAQINLNLQNANNRLRVYFTENFEVREGYSYTLSLPFQEIPDGEGNPSNSCDGTILINLKIVPDYEVWTGAAGNTDWNNDENWRRADGNTRVNPWASGDPDEEKLDSDELYRKNGASTNVNSPLHRYMTNHDNYRTPKDRVFRKGFAPLYCTHVLMKSDEWGNAPVLYDPLDYNVEDAEHKFTDEPFPNLRETSTPILKFDMQARRYDLWEETYGVEPDRGETNRTNDLIAEMYKVNSCDEIAFQPGTELLNAHLLNYNTAWMEYQLENKRWYLLGSPLQGTISGEWYAPTGTAKQETTYYDPVAFRPKYAKVKNPKATDNPAELGWYTLSGQTYSAATDTEVDSSKDYYYQTFNYSYDRYSPAIYQRSWDKAKAVLYEVGSDYATTDDAQTNDDDIASQGSWNTTWQAPTGGADAYLDRLGYKPFGEKKANVAIKGIWSNTYNDAQVDYATGGFSVMVMNHLKNNDTSGGTSIIRLPKEDTMYDYYEFAQTNANDGGTDTELSLIQTDPKDRALNRGRLKTDLLLPEMKDNSQKPIIHKEEKEASIYGDKRTYTRIPIKEDSLQVMNATFYPQGENAPTAGFFTETIPAGISQLGYYLVENPFPCGLDMDKFFAANPALEAKYWLLTKTGQHLVQKAGDAGEWITTTLSPVVYPNPNYTAPVDPGSDDPGSDDPAPTEPEILTFYPYAVLAPGQGFFVTLKEANLDDSDEPLEVTFNNAMQTQSRFGVIDGEGREFEVVVGQSQRMEELKENGETVYILVDNDNDGIPETQEPVMVPVYQTVQVDLNGNGIKGETYTIEENGETITIVEEEQQPVLDPITETVKLYKYKQETLALADETTVNKEYPLRARRTRSSIASNIPGLVITALRGSDKSSALVMKRENASDDFLPSEDTETFICTEDLKYVPTVYTLCGRLATTINSIHDFTFLPLGVESASDAPCVLTFQGVELLGDSVAFYDAVERKLTPLESGMTFAVSGQTLNRYYIVNSLNEEKVAEETHLQIFTEGRTVKVIASTAEPITSVRCYDAAGRLVHSASPQTMEYSFTLPDDGIYIIEAKTEKDRKTKKVAVK